MQLTVELRDDRGHLLMRNRPGLLPAVEISHRVAIDVIYAAGQAALAAAIETLSAEKVATEAATARSRLVIERPHRRAGWFRRRQRPSGLEGQATVSDRTAGTSPTSTGQPGRTGHPGPTDAAGTPGPAPTPGAG